MSNASSLEEYYAELENILLEPSNDPELFSAIVNAPFKNKMFSTSLDLGIVVLLQVNKKEEIIERVALSSTDPADWSVKMSPIPFHEIKIPLNHPENILSKTISLNKPHHTIDWKFLFIPALAPEAARFNQAGAGIACSFTYPLNEARQGGAMIFSYYQPIDELDKTHTEFMQKYSQLVTKALQ